MNMNYFYTVDRSLKASADNDSKVFKVIEKIAKSKNLNLFSKQQVCNNTIVKGNKAIAFAFRTVETDTYETGWGDNEGEQIPQIVTQIKRFDIPEDEPFDILTASSPDDLENELINKHIEIVSKSSCIHLDDL